MTYEDQVEEQNRQLEKKIQEVEAIYKDKFKILQEEMRERKVSLSKPLSPGVSVREYDTTTYVQAP
jgi:hypothetical protein